MNTEEKARAYDEALEQVKKELAACGSMDCDAARLIFRLFPQLRESEDERIRKRLIGFVSDIAGGWPFEEHRITKKEAITYLEKQKEASKAIEAVEKIDKYIDEHLANAHDMKDSNPDKKYYRGWDDALGKMAGILQDVYSNEKQKDHFRDDTKKVEKQDYSGLTDLEKAIHRGFLCAGVENVPVTIIKETAQECLAEMKSAEWSEEDKKCIQSIISCLKYLKTQDTERRWNGDHNAHPEHYAELITKLQSIFSRTHWKPSEEQMEAFKGYIEDFQARAEAAVGEWNNFDVMIRLYEQLKKL